MQHRRLSCLIPQNTSLLENLTLRETLQVAAKLKLGCASKEKLYRCNTVGSNNINWEILLFCNANTADSWDLSHSRLRWLHRYASGVPLGRGAQKIVLRRRIAFKPSSYVFWWAHQVQFFSIVMLILYETFFSLGTAAWILVPPNRYCLTCAYWQRRDAEILYARSTSQAPSSFRCWYIGIFIYAHQNNEFPCLQSFDSIYVLSEGRCVIKGPRDLLVQNLANMNFQCPQFYNPADFGNYFNLVLIWANLLICII